MANKMLIDATHAEETRVVVLRGNRVEEFDFESAQRKQLRGNIYLAKVTRVEPSLQAAFIDYGGNRHGFLAFSEIHPDYYQIPIADRQALIEEEGRAQRAAEDEDDRRSGRYRRGGALARRGNEVLRSEPATVPAHDAAAIELSAGATGGTETQLAEPASDAGADEARPPTHSEAPSVAEHEQPNSGPAPAEAAVDEAYSPTTEPTPMPVSAPSGVESEIASEGVSDARSIDERSGTEGVSADSNGVHNGEDDAAAEEVIESVGGADALEEVPDRAPRYRRQYKIQEVIKRRQVMLVQVVKEERGTKGAALTTYLSLAGRYCVLMPNTARGGGISRKITNADDRSRLKEIAQELEVPEGMGVIVRTAGASRTKTEIKRDFEYLLRLWETVRDLTLRSTAPKLVYEEGSLVKRSIRDLYSKDIDEVVVAGAEGYHEAKNFMRMLTPSHAKNVKHYADTQPLLSRYGVENQLDAMFSPVVQLRSGGYVVLNQAEALVAIDVNSGRATREHHIEDTALTTNLEAADEIARQLRLRDLAGLIVIDFIDMEEKRNNRSVERRLKECLKLDRARIQVGRISHFGLLEMSRQRIRASVLESSTEKCPYCGGTGHVRSVSSLALQILRALEEQLMKGATHNLIVRTRPDVALYALNQKRAHLRALEERFAIAITISADQTVPAPQAFLVDRGEQVHTSEAAKVLAEQTEATAATAATASPLEDEDDLKERAGAVEAEPGEAAGAAAEQSEPGTRRRRRRRRRGRNGTQPSAPGRAALHDPHAERAESATEGFDEAPTLPDDEIADETVAATGVVGSEAGEPRAGDHRRRRRGRRGGRRNRPEREADAAPMANEQHSQSSEHALGPPEEIGSPTVVEAELKNAVADLDAAPTAPRSPHAAGPGTPEATQPPAQVAERELPRRRSTVREPVPIADVADGNEAAPPAPAQPSSPAAAPAVTEASESDNADRPRRSGWWSRRFAGG